MSLPPRRLFAAAFLLAAVYACGSDAADPPDARRGGSGGEDDTFRPVGGTGGKKTSGGGAGAGGEAITAGGLAGAAGSPTSSAGSGGGGVSGMAGSAPKTSPPSSKDLTGVTTLQKRRLPVHAVSPKAEGKNPSNFNNLPGYFEDGWGEIKDAPGEAHLSRTLDTTAPPPPGPNPKRLSRFVHLAVLQVVDDESPQRFANLDDTLWPSARPQDPYLCQMANASVRSIRSVHAKDPVDFVLLGGDNAENGLENELSWVMSIFNGKQTVNCDSGDDDDLIPGPANDGKDPFFAEGLGIPWKWVSGNHDMLVAGNYPPNAMQRMIALGEDAPNGTRVYTSGGAITSGNGVAVKDASRVLLDRSSFLDIVKKDGDGHGLGQAQVDSGYANYTFDVAGTPLRFIVLDFTSAVGGAEGLLRVKERDGFVKPALDKAKKDGKWVILSSHHATASMTKSGGIPPIPQSDAVLPADYLKLVSGYDNVLFSMVGHSHEHVVRAVGAEGGHQWWEVMTSAIADFPHQFRTIEITDQDNGWVTLKATCVDFAIDDDPVAAEGYRRGVIDYTTGHLPPPRLGEPSDRNVELWARKPK